MSTVIYATACGRRNESRTFEFLLLESCTKSKVPLLCDMYVYIIYTDMFRTYTYITHVACIVFLCAGIYTYIYIYIWYPSIYLSMYLSIYLSTSIYLAIHLFIYLSVYLCIYLPIYLSIYICIYPSVHLSIYSSIHLSIYPPIYVSIYLSIYLSTQWIQAARSAAKDSSICIHIYWIYIWIHTLVHWIITNALNSSPNDKKQIGVEKYVWKNNYWINVSAQAIQLQIVHLLLTVCCLLMMLCTHKNLHSGKWIDAALRL